MEGNLAVYGMPVCQNGSVKSRWAQFETPCRAVAREAANMGALSIVVGTFLFLVTGACAFSDCLLDAMTEDEKTPL